MTETVRIVQVATELPAHREEASTISTYLEKWMLGPIGTRQRKSQAHFPKFGSSGQALHYSY